jgi:hypothetical protein
MSDETLNQLQKLAEHLADANLHDFAHTVLKAISHIKGLEENRDWYRDRVVWGFYEDATPHYIQGREGEHEINDPVSADQIRAMYKAVEIYQRERDRFKHSKPEITGAFFLSGGHGDKDENMLPQYITVCPAYGAGWDQVYEKTARTISYEGS